MPGYADVLNPDLLERIPLDARVVLDVGCGTGALGAEYKRRNPACRFLGIEADPDAARIAAKRLDQVVTGDVEADPMPFEGLRIDCLIYGDVLEHLRDPWTLLRLQARSLSPRGLVLICMPNAEHWSFAERLLRGSFDYEDQGLFDRTHLRWFTQSTTLRALADAGLVAHSASPRIFDLSAARAFTKVMEPSLAALGIDAASYLGRASPLQYVWRAGPVELPRLHIVSSMLSPVGGVSDVRVTEPMAAIATDASIIAHVVPHAQTVDLPPNVPKIFILHRPALVGDAALPLLRHMLDAGYLVVCEFDDHPGYIPVLQQPDVLNFRAVHAIQTSTEPLAEVLRAMNPEVAVFPNAIRRLPDVRNYADPGRLTLFFGALNRQDDWRPFVPALNRVAAMAGARLQFKVVADREFFDALETPNKSFAPLCDYQTYNDILSRCDVSFMPLTDNAFNRCKSDLKYLEAAACRVTPLASAVVYGDTIEDGRTGLLFADADGLQRQLLRLLSDTGLGRSLGDSARSYVMRHRMLAYQVARRADWYKSLWNRRETLHRELLARMPQLASEA
jgi:SAM-dependent methyltransferase